MEWVFEVLTVLVRKETDLSHRTDLLIEAEKKASGPSCVHADLLAYQMLSLRCPVGPRTLSHPLGLDLETLSMSHLVPLTRTQPLNLKLGSLSDPIRTCGCLIIATRIYFVLGFRQSPIYVAYGVTPLNYTVRAPTSFVWVTSSKE